MTLIEDQRGGVVSVPLHSGAARTRIRMLRTSDQLQRGLSYNLPNDRAQALIALGYAETVVRPMQPSEVKPIGPSETKPTGPSEVKVSEPKTKRKKKS